MQVRSLDFKEREFHSTEVGGVCVAGQWYVAKSLIGDFEIHKFEDRDGWFLFWRDNRRGELLESKVGAIGRADYEYENIILGEFVSNHEKEGIGGE